ncbi:hypothetical protein KXD96_25415 [Mycobacterium sp. SMC-2]|uniref:hypothetical protein n=1 Tax=Mycobacterium sp. SMC-2 TaxID=2857058 RepID=UPI0021B49117|nr:hypothetical protein [Mycobacterium sp. SMC-2]UXA06169.1 hypothetical protein KXD96_25415 [Mycobacterium sp. SMC-2]
MRSIRMASTAALFTATAIVMASSANASKDDVAINGTYRATSIGNWAKVRDSYHDEATVISTWTISSSCTTAEQCDGTVRSDQGWSAPMTMTDGKIWWVKRDVANWETCPDGTSYTGHQTFYFYAVDSNGIPQIGSPTLAGKDKTLGPSGACGVNKWLDIEIPFRLDKIG